jgi:hypothetical protein
MCEISRRLRDFQGSVERVGSLVLAFQAFHQIRHFHSSICHEVLPLRVWPRLSRTLPPRHAIRPKNTEAVQRGTPIIERPRPSLGGIFQRQV